MTLVNHETGEIIDTIDADEARRLTDAAQHEFRSSREHFDRAWSLIEQAVEGGGHVALGYRSPGDYLHAEFDGVLSGLDVTERRVAVRTMTDWGLSTRAIAPVIGVSHVQVTKDRHAGGNPVTTSPKNPAAEPTSTVSSESTSVADTQQEPEGGSTDAAAKPVTDGTAPAAPPPPIVGIDGKTYARPTPKPLKPVVDEVAWTEQDRAEELASNLAVNISLLYALTNPERRAEFIANWHLGVDHRPVLGQKYVHPTYMREIADALRIFADEWEHARV